MISKETVIYSLRNLRHRSGRSLLTIFSILIGIAAIFVFISFGLGLENYMSQFLSQTSADKVSIMPKGMGIPGMDDTFAFTEEDLKAIEKASGVREATGLYVKVVEISQRGEKKFTFLASYDPSTPLMLEFFGDIGIYKGRQLRKGDERKVVLGFNYLIENKIFPQAYDLNDKITINGEELTIVGFFEQVGNPSDDAQVYLTNDFMRKFYSEENLKGYAWIIARVDINNMDIAIKNIEKNLRKSRNLEEGKEDFYVQSFQDYIKSYTGALNILVGFIIAIALVSVLVSAVNTSNTMITSVLERTKEIGIIKSVGAKNSEILGIFLFESAFLGFVSGVLGVLLGTGISLVADKVLNELGYGFFGPVFPPILFIGCILFATITGAVSGVIPAIRASKIRPVEALHYE